MPVSAKNAGRKEQAAKASSSKPSSNAINQMNNAMTEEEKMAAMFAAQTEQWSAQQEEMSHQTPVFKPGQKRPANVPDHEPPTGYICYRCGNKGHWIQLCPTNDDPEFDNRPRVKRTTGIPRSFLQKVDKATVLAQTDGDESKRPSGIMVNAEGDFVIAEPDKASWEKFQAKTKTSTVKGKTSDDQEIRELGLECPIDNKMFIEPLKTPCCQKTFCNDCITIALMDSDFVCPSCRQEGVLIDDLQPDEEASKKIQEYLTEKENAKSPAPESPKPKEEQAEVPKEKEASQEPEIKSPEKQAEDQKPQSASKSPTSQNPIMKSPVGEPVKPDEKAVVKSETESNSKKRPADDLLENPKIPRGPKAMQNQQNQPQMPNMMNGMPNMGMNNMMFNGMPNMMPNMMGMNMNMGMPMMNMPMMNMPGFPGMNGMNGMNAGMGNGMGNFGMNGWDMNAMGGMNGMNGMNMNGMNGGMNMNGNGMNGFQTGMNFPQNGTEDDAYFRKPVNPHRHQNKQRRVRPSDYREL
jgi:protein MPE1